MSVIQTWFLLIDYNNGTTIQSTNDVRLSAFASTIPTTDDGSLLFLLLSCFFFSPTNSLRRERERETNTHGSLIPNLLLSCTNTFLIRSRNNSSPPAGVVYGGGMEISSRTIISWFFHLHGNVRFVEDSCASSVTFSRCYLFASSSYKRERERERCQWIQKDPLARMVHHRKARSKYRRNNTISNLVHSGTMRDASSKIRGGTHGTRDDDDQMKSDPKKKVRMPRQTAPLSPRFQTVAPPSFIDDW